MNDGGMGSLEFESCKPSRKAHELVEAQFEDIDGTLVSVSVNVDQDGDLFELDFWKVDFSPLLRFPAASAVVIVPTKQLRQN